MKQLGKSKILTVQTKRKMWVGFALPTSDMQQGNGVIGYRGLFVSKWGANADEYEYSRNVMSLTVNPMNVNECSMIQPYSYDTL